MAIEALIKWICDGCGQELSIQAVTTSGMLQAPSGWCALMSGLAAGEAWRHYCRGCVRKLEVVE